MNRKTLLIALLSGSILTISGGLGSAAPFTATHGAATNLPNAGIAEPVAQKVVRKKTVVRRNGTVVRKRTVYSRGNHGPRYRARRSGYGYYHEGYWYRRPWWGVGIPGGPAIVIRP